VRVKGFPAERPRSGGQTVKKMHLVTKKGEIVRQKGGKTGVKGLLRRGVKKRKQPLLVSVRAKQGTSSTWKREVGP